MRPADIGQHTDSRTDNRLQGFHFTHFRNTGFEDSQFGMFVHHPYRQRHSDLRIIATRRTDDSLVRTQQLVKPFLHDGLSIASGYSDYGHLILFPMFPRKALQGFQHIAYHQKIHIGAVFHFFRNLCNHKVIHTSRIQFRYVFMPVIAFGLQCEKKRFLRETQ